MVIIIRIITFLNYSGYGHQNKYITYIPLKYEYYDIILTVPPVPELDRLDTVFSAKVNTKPRLRDITPNISMRTCVILVDITVHSS